MRSGRLLFAALLGLLPLGGARAAEDAARAFFQGKQIQFFTMGSPGGGYDAYTRALCIQLEKRVGAKAVTINEPAAGGLVAMNRLLVARPDALTMVLLGGEGLMMATLMGEPGVNFDIDKQTWLARVSAENKVMLLGPKSPYKNLGEMLQSDRPVIWAGAGKADGNTDYQALVSYTTGMKTKIVIGYKGTAGMNLAMETGEVDGRVVSDEAAALYGPTSGMHVVTVLGRKRAEQFPDVQTVFEATKLSPDATRLLDWRAGIASLGRVIAVTPGSPQDRIDLLRATFREVLQDPAFVAEMKKANLSVGFAGGEEVGGLISRAMNTLDAKGVAELKDIIIDRFY